MTFGELLTLAAILLAGNAVLAGVLGRWLGGVSARVDDLSTRLARLEGGLDRERQLMGDRGPIGFSGDGGWR